MNTYLQSFQIFKETSKEKELIIDIIKENTAISKNATILDIGSADGNISKAIQANHKNITLVDIIDQTESEATYIRLPFEKIKLTKKYDLIIACHVLGHFYKNKTANEALTSMIDNLSLKGQLIIGYNTNEGYMMELLKHMRQLYAESRFEPKEKELIHKKIKIEKNYHSIISGKTFEELADLTRILFANTDKEYNAQFNKICEFYKRTLHKPEFAIEQKILFIGK